MAAHQNSTPDAGSTPSTFALKRDLISRERRVQTIPSEEVERRRLSARSVAHSPVKRRWRAALLKAPQRPKAAL